MFSECGFISIMLCNLKFFFINNVVITVVNKTRKTKTKIKTCSKIKIDDIVGVEDNAKR